MSIFNYFVIGLIYTFLIDVLYSSKKIKNHPSLNNSSWGYVERIICVVIWPLALIVFVNAFIKAYFKK